MHIKKLSYLEFASSNLMFLSLAYLLIILEILVMFFASDEAIMLRSFSSEAKSYDNINKSNHKL